MPSNLKPGQCQNRIYDGNWPRNCHRKQAEGDTLCKVCRAARKRGEAARKAADAARAAEWAMDAWRRSVASAERDVVKAAKLWRFGEEGGNALGAAVDRLIAVQEKPPV
jgi:hypothetical protein